MSPYILGISGSPRKNGNSDSMVRLTMEKITSGRDLQTRFERIADADIKPCRGCRACMKIGDCIIRDDDFHPLFRRLLEASIVIIGAPVYWNGPPGVMKNFIDRTHAYYRCPETVVSSARIGVVSVAADSGFTSHDDIMTCWLQYYQLKLVATVRILAREKGDYLTRPEQMLKLDRFAAALIDPAIPAR